MIIHCHHPLAQLTMLIKAFTGLMFLTSASTTSSTYIVIRIEAAKRQVEQSFLLDMMEFKDHPSIFRKEVTWRASWAVWRLGCCPMVNWTPRFGRRRGSEGSFHGPSNHDVVWVGCHPFSRTTMKCQSIMCLELSTKAILKNSVSRLEKVSVKVFLIWNHFSCDTFNHGYREDEPLSPSSKQLFNQRKQRRF